MGLTVPRILEQISMCGQYIRLLGCVKLKSGYGLAWAEALTQRKKKAEPRGSALR